MQIKILVVSYIQQLCC